MSDFDFNELIKLLFLLPIIIIFLGLILKTTSILEEGACQPYIQQIQQKEAQIKALNKQIEVLNEKLANLSAEYERLRTENITKADIEEIKQQINITQLQINYLDQQLQIVNENFIHAYNVYYKTYVFSIALNIALAGYITLDLISATLFNTSIQVLIAKKIKVILKRLHKTEK
ncbi:FlxA-like family protein [Thermococcus barophilus]|uniref:Uncharacterized protein n=1 Tax=Thermococcus barophilus (strain DSM 11836 / MP) TaxID=391623 RepID=F0LIW5_THEBM|nr:FlxA-like family protein [Thermococcus barophilus]ADT84567.1 hypothetical protein TERMP_01592 [Thermococcus barophilus MP]